MTTLGKRIATAVATYGVFAAAVALMVTAAVVRDAAFMAEHPVRFAVETLLVAYVPAAVVVGVMQRTRDLTTRDSLLWIALLGVKLALFHVLLQLSGVYADLGLVKR